MRLVCSIMQRLISQVLCIPVTVYSFPRKSLELSLSEQYRSVVIFCLESRISFYTTPIALIPIGNESKFTKLYFPQRAFQNIKHRIFGVIFILALLQPLLDSQYT